MLCTVSTVTSDLPTFGCSSQRCVLSDQRVQKSLFVQVGPKSSVNVTLLTGWRGGTNIEIRFPRRYGSKDIAVSAPQSVARTTDNDTTINPYWQVATFTYGKGAASNGTVIVLANLGFDTLPVQIIWGRGYRVTVMQVICLPIAMYQTHGPFWVQQGFFWVFLIVCATLATVYVAFSKVRLWQAVLVYAICAFTTVLCEKLYHSIVASIRVSDVSTTVYSIVVVALCAEGVPAIFCMFFIRHGKCRPVSWAILGLIVATGFLFLAGSGWFVGVGLLATASLMRLVGRLI